MNTPHDVQPGPTDRERLVAAHVAAQTFFAEQLAAEGGDSPRAYLIGRGLAAALDSPTWSIGYAPASWTDLTDRLRAEGFTEEELLASGLTLATKRGTVIDRFRDRVTMGVHDADGSPVGFIARAAPNASPGMPKYLNSPRTPLYDKRAVLFGLGEQKEQLAAATSPRDPWPSSTRRHPPPWRPPRAPPRR